VNADHDPELDVNRPAAERFVLVDMLNATAKSLGWKPFSADTADGRVTVTYTTNPEVASLMDQTQYIPKQDWQ